MYQADTPGGTVNTDRNAWIAQLLDDRSEKLFAARQFRAFADTNGYPYTSDLIFGIRTMRSELMKAGMTLEEVDAVPELALKH